MMFSVIRDNFLITLFVVLSAICNVSLTDISRPRGVSILKSSLYEPGKNFVCLDGLKTVSFSQVNDDYCDCKDGSDEPGTSACPDGTFHCTNQGYKSFNIPSSRVNDGVCDCCDSSDEYGPTATKCLNTCFELGREARLEAQRIAELSKMGGKLRSEMIQKGAILKSQQQERLQQLEKNKAEADLIKQEKETLKANAELLETAALQQYRDAEEAQRQANQQEEDKTTQQEATEAFHKFDSNQNGFIEISELQTKITFDQNHDGVVSEDEARFFLDEHDQLNLNDFVNVAWARIKPYMMLESGIFTPPSEPQDEEVEQDDAESEDQHDANEDNGEDLEDEEQDEADDNQEDVGEGEVKSVETETKTTYDPETQRLIDLATEARNNYNQADRQIRDIENEMSNIKDALEKDYGEHEEFATLSGHCFDYQDREYIYKLCPFDRVSQQPKNGGSETRLGIWGSWSGPSSNKHSVMMYTQGALCWNGPHRSTEVHIICGLETKILSVSEPNRCEYLFKIETPAACIEISENASEQTEVHDEL